MPESSKIAYSNAHMAVSSKINEIENITENILCTIKDLKEADIRCEKLLADHEERNSKAFVDIYSNIKTLAQISEQADMHLCQQLAHNAEENKLKFKRIKYALIISGIANILSLAGLIIFYILNYCT